MITSIACQKNNDTSALIWAQAGDLTCAAHGSFLSNGTPVIAEAATLGHRYQEEHGSTVTLTLPATLPAGTKSWVTAEALLGGKSLVKAPIPQ